MINALTGRRRSLVTFVALAGLSFSLRLMFHTEVFIHTALASSTPAESTLADETKNTVDTAYLNNNLAHLADQHYLNDSMTWITAQALCGQGQARFKGLWKSYKGDPHHGWSCFIAQQGRTWIYDDALGIYTELKYGRWAKAQNKMDEAEQHGENARRAVASLVDLAKWEEARGYQGIWHFAYDTRGDYVAPNGPMGAVLWGLNAIYAYILQTGDKTYLEWINNQLKTFVFSQQITDPDDPRYGLIQAGLRRKGDQANDPMTWCNIEHNTEYLGTLRLAARAAETNDQEFVQELAQRHEWCVKAMLKNFWKSDHFCTLITATGEVSTLVSADTVSWTPLALMPYMDPDDVWKCIDYLKRNFVIETDTGERAKGWHWDESIKGGSTVVLETEVISFDKKLKGLFFFSKEHGEELPQKDRVRLEQMIHAEATAHAGLFLLRYAGVTSDESRRREALAFLQELYEGLVGMKNAYGGKGTPCATLNIQDHSNTLESMSGTGPGAMLTLALLGVPMDDFLGVIPPRNFRVGDTPPSHDFESR